MNGGDGDDKLWFEESENPLVPCPGVRLDPTSVAGLGTDDCGDNSNWDPNATPPELPVCEAYITVKPTKCDGAN